jgi:hypothetical protein
LLFVDNEEKRQAEYAVHLKEAKLARRKARRQACARDELEDKPKSKEKEKTKIF